MSDVRVWMWPALPQTQRVFRAAARGQWSRLGRLQVLIENHLRSGDHKQGVNDWKRGSAGVQQHAARTEAGEAAEAIDTALARDTPRSRSICSGSMQARLKRSAQGKVAEEKKARLKRLAQGSVVVASGGREGRPAQGYPRWVRCFSGTPHNRSSSHHCHAAL